MEIPQKILNYSTFTMVQNSHPSGISNIESAYSEMYGFKSVYFLHLI